MPCTLRTLLACGVSLGAHGFAQDDANSLLQLSEHIDFDLKPAKTGACPGNRPRILDFSLCNPANGEARNTLLTVNNLGGQGPETEKTHEMRFSNVSHVAGVGWLDLVIKNSTNWEYVNLTNGHGSGGTCLASINIKSKTSTTLDMMLTPHGDDEPLSGVGDFDIPFTILDVDSQNLKSEEFVVMETYKDGDLHWQAADCGEAIDRVDTAIENGALRISSKSNWAGKGDLSDNPVHPQELEQGAKERSVEVRLKNRDVAQWTVTAGSKGGSAGRHFYFAGSSNIGGTTQTTTPCDCTEYPDHFDWNIGGAVIESNADNNGRHARYPGVAVVNGASLDLVAEPITEYLYNNITRNTEITAQNKPGLKGSFGVVNLAANSMVNLRFRFVKTGTNVLADLANESFRFTVYDLDQGTPEYAKERVTIVPPATGSVSSAVIGASVKALSDTTAFPLEVESNIFGTGSDNPSSDEATALDTEQARSVGVSYHNTAEWIVSLQATFSSMPGGRNFMFAGCRHLGAWLLFPSADTGFGQERL